MTNNVLASLKQHANESAIDEVLGAVVVNEELLDHVSGGLMGWGYMPTVSGECTGGNVRCDFWNWFN